MPIEIAGRTYYRTLEVCRAVGISRATLLRWLQEGVFENPCRDRRGWRLFTKVDLNRIQAEASRIEPAEKSQAMEEARGNTSNDLLA